MGGQDDSGSCELGKLVGAGVSKWRGNGSFRFPFQEQRYGSSLPAAQVAPPSARIPYRTGGGGHQKHATSASVCQEIRAHGPAQKGLETRCLKEIFITGRPRLFKGGKKILPKRFSLVVGFFSDLPSNDNSSLTIT
ncbi:hypothetical protein HNY73_018645 [Argiope bruennichi]|uniref:Uncharacterized protein n=1 Tax=Argiope bruennichi TaxID=94029 RepID=A0A8T0EGX5_ARGBR|nr:hypothetical protein HNY73_018645 [Argiope bruennichi]